MRTQIHRLGFWQRLRPTKKYRRATGNKTPKKRLDWEHIEGGVGVVKGISKRVVVVNSPDPKIFEQAIFIVREDFAGQAGVSEQEVLRQAREAADSYIRKGALNTDRLLARAPASLIAAAGAAATGIAWLALKLCL
jgi:hypothetical protein